MDFERYRDAMDHVPFDPRLEARVLNRLSETAARPRRTPAFSRRRVLAVAAAAALCLAVTAGAYASVSGLFAPLFGGHPEIVDQSGAPVSASATSAGYTVTADALFGDQNNLYVAMTLTRADGGTIDADDLFFHLAEIDLPGFNGGGYGAQVHPGQGETAAVSLAATLHSYTPIPQGKTLTLSFDRIARVGEDVDAPALAQGDWALSFPVRCGDLTQSIPLESPIPIGDTGLSFDTVSLSPLSAWVSGQGAPRSEEDLERVLGLLESGGFSLTLKDGTVIDLFQVDGDFRSRGYSLQEEGTYRVHMDATFQELIPLEEMESLNICGKVIQLDF